MQEFRHGTIVCSCGYRTQRCDCCPGRVLLRPNICLSCQQAMQTPGVVEKAIQALTHEAERLERREEYLWPSDPSNKREGSCLSILTFLEAKDKLSILLMSGCDWYYWARRADVMNWKKLGDWQPWHLVFHERCFDCKQDIQKGFISFPTGVLLCPGCKDALDRAKEVPAPERG